MKPQVLISGFSVFPSAPVNPTETLIKWLILQDLSHLDAEFHFHLFKTSYAQVDSDLAALSKQLNPDIVLHFGLDQNAIGFKLESMGRNELHVDKPDVDGFCPDASILPDSTDEILSTFPIDEIEARLKRKGFAVQRSEDAGGYLCNYLLYRTLSNLCWQKPPRYAGFIHVPYLVKHCSVVGEKAAADISFMEWEILHNGCLEIADVCLERLAQE